MSYERLTKKRNDGTYYIKKCDKADCDGYCCCCDLGFDEEIRERLGELEDKIENGVLAELPYKIGTLVYVIHTNWETGELDVQITDVVGYEIMRGELWVKTSIPYRKCYIEIENVFLTKAEAEEKLRELRGEKE